MTEKAKDARRAYKREWSRKNRERMKEAEARYWERKAAAAAPDQGAQEISEKAKEMRRAYKREWNRKNRDKVKANVARYWERKAAAQEQKTDEPA